MQQQITPIFYFLSYRSTLQYIEGDAAHAAHAGRANPTSSPRHCTLVGLRVHARWWPMKHPDCMEAIWKTSTH